MSVFTSDDAWFGDDKLAHTFGAYSLSLTVGLFTTPLIGALVAVVAGVAVELVELFRYKSWQRHGGIPPWPFLADLISWKDLIVDVVGAFAAVLTGYVTYA